MRYIVELTLYTSLLLTAITRILLITKQLWRVFTHKNYIGVITVQIYAHFELCVRLCVRYTQCGVLESVW